MISWNDLLQLVFDQGMVELKEVSFRVKFVNVVFQLVNELEAFSNLSKHCLGG